MKTLYKVINTQNVYDLGVRLGDVVEAEKLNSDCFKAYPRQHLTEWTIEFVLFRLYQLEKIRNTAETFEDTLSSVCAEPTSPEIPISELQSHPTPEKTIVTKDGVLLPVYNNEGTDYAIDHPMCSCVAPPSPENDLPISEVPTEAKEASTVLPVPSTSTSHDSHYASMAIEPVTISEMIMENESIPPKARYHAAKSVEYFTRGGRKEGQDWKKDFEKALNHGYRAIHGKWPWEVRDH